MPSHLPALEAIKAIPRQPQTQTSLHAQLIALREAANRLGLYDAADFLRGNIEATEERLHTSDLLAEQHAVERGYP